jgi:hypothetical protein
LGISSTVRFADAGTWWVKWHTSGTESTLRMLYFECKGQMFYAGQEGLESRHETRAAAK